MTDRGGADRDEDPAEEETTARDAEAINAEDDDGVRGSMANVSHTPPDWSGDGDASPNANEVFARGGEALGPDEEQGEGPTDGAAGVDPHPNDRSPDASPEPADE